MKILPRSLLGRMSLIFSLAIIGTGVIATILTVWNSEKKFQEVVQHYLIQRMIDDIYLFEVMNARQRQEASVIRSNAFYTIDTIEQPTQAKKSPITAQLKSFEKVLKDKLPSQATFFVAVDKIALKDKVRDKVNIQVKLKDGQWLNVQRLLPSGKQQVTSYVLWPTLLSVLVVVLGVVFFAARWINKPLQRLSRAALAFGENIHVQPLIVSGPLEVQRAARAFNRMQQQLKKYLAERTRIFAAISHDLKTPLTRMRLRVELLEDETLRNKFISDLTELEQLVTASLEYMRSSQYSEEKKSVDLNSLLLQLQRNFTDTNMLMVYRETPCGLLPLQELAIKRCLSNFIENAIRYGGQATVTLLEYKQYVKIVIKDRGPGIPPAEIKNVFEPFYRLESSRNKQTGGHGLGLTIAENIIKSHGGRLKLESVLGEGTTVRIKLFKHFESAPYKKT